MRKLFGSCIGLIVAIGGIVLLCWAVFHEIPRMHAIQGAQGRVTTGHVVDKRESISDDSHEYLIKYSYQANGNEYNEENSFERGNWQRLNIGDPLEVRYLATEPEFAYATQSFKAGRNAGLMIFAGIVVIVFGVIIVLASLLSRR